MAPIAPGSVTAPKSAAGRKPSKSSCGSPPHRRTTRRREESEDGTRRRLLARAYAVFAAEQVDGAEEIIAQRAERLAQRDTPERITAADAYFAAIDATIIEGGNRAYYQPSTDTIHIPTLDRFDQARPPCRHARPRTRPLDRPRRPPEP